MAADEPLMAQLGHYGGMKLQDASKQGLQYGDEDDDEAEKTEFEAQKIAFAPLISWLKKDLEGRIGDGKSPDLPIRSAWTSSDPQLS